MEKFEELVEELERAINEEKSSTSDNRVNRLIAKVNDIAEKYQLNIDESNHLGDQNDITYRGGNRG